jgi:hypothetical protein
MDDRENPYAAPRSDPQVAPEFEGSILSSPGIRRTATGLGLVYYGIMLILTLFILALAIVVLKADARQAFFPGVPLGLAVIGAALMMFVGQVLCIAVPSESGARGLILGCVILNVVSFVVSVATSPAIGEGGGGGNLLGMTGALLFILFLRKLSHYIGRDDLGARAGRVLVLFLVSAGAVAVGVFMAVARVSTSPLLFALGGVLALVTFVLYVNLINAVRRALRGA